MPMNTTFVTRVPKCSSSDTTWSTISCGARLRANPPLPVAQNVQRMGQPTCEETHAVSRCLPFSVAGMPTVSTTRSSASRSNSLAVPSVAAATWCTADLPIRTFAAFSASRALFGSVVRSSTVRAGVAPYRWSRSCFPRNAGRPFSFANVFSSAVVKPSRWNSAGASDLSRSSAEGVVAEGAAVKMERSYVARASLWDSSTKRASRSFHSPSRTPFARGTCVGSTAAAFSCAAARHTCAGGAGRADGRTRARSDARGRDPAKVVTESAVAAAADIVRLLHHGARSGK